MSKKPAFVLKEFLAQKDKSTNDAVVALRPEMYATAKSEDKEAKLKRDTIGALAHCFTRSHLRARPPRRFPSAKGGDRAEPKQTDIACQRSWVSSSSTSV